MSPEIVELADGTELEALRPEWDALWRRMPAATPFQSPAWLLPWWREFGSGELLALAVREAGRLEGLLPLYILAEAGCRKLLPLGAGLTDRLDPLLAPRHAEPALLHLARQARRFDRFDVMDLAPGSPLLTAAAPPGWRDEPHACLPRPVLALPARPRKLPYYRRRAERLGAVSHELAGAEGLDEALSALFDLHAARWLARGEAGVLGDPAVRRFHREAAGELQAAGLLRCHVVRLDGRIVAVLHGFADAACHYAYISGYDPGLPHPGLGAMLVGLAVQAAQAEGLRHFDFLRGREAYKYAWGAVDQPARGRRLIPPA